MGERVMMHNNDKGFTLIEIVIVVVVLAILGGFTFRFVEFATTSYTTGTRQTQLFQEATYAMERLTQELKDAKQVTFPWSNYIIIHKANTAGQTDSNEQISYFLYDEKLYRGVSSWWLFGARVITERVSRFEAGSSATPCDSSNPDCTVTIDLELEDKTITAGSGSVKVSINTKVAPKNFESGVGGRSYNGYYYDTVE